MKYQQSTPAFDYSQIAALAIVDQTANPKTPRGDDTIARQLSQKATAQLGGGQPAVPAPPQPGITGLARNAATGAGIQMQQQQDAQQRMMQMAQAQQAQQAQQPVMAAEGGIASLSMGDEDYEYMDGGIIGYAGGGEAEDDKKPLDAAAQTAIQEAQRTGDRSAMMSTLKNLGAAGYDIATLIPRAFMGVTEDLSNTRLGRALGVDFKLPQAAYGGDRESMTPMMDKLRREEQGIASVANNYDSYDMQGGAPAPRPAVPSRMPSRAPSAPTAPVFTMPADPTFAESAAEVKKEFPGADRTEANRLYERRRELVDSRPDFESTGIANLRDQFELENEAAGKRKETRDYDRMMAYFGAGRGLGSAGKAATAFDTVARAEDAAQRKLEALRNEGILNLQMQKHAAAVNDTDALAKLRNDMDKLADETSRVQASAAAAIYGTKVTSDTRGMVAAMNLAAKGSGVKPPPGMNFGDIEKLQGLVDAAVPAANPLQSQFFVDYVSKYVPNGKQLLQDMQDPGWFGSARAKKEDIANAVRLAQQAYREKLLGQSKFGASAAAGATSYDDAMRDLEAS